MSKLAHATAGAPGDKAAADRRNLDDTIAREVMDAKTIQRQTNCSWSEALRLTSGAPHIEPPKDVDEAYAAKVEHATGRHLPVIIDSPGAYKTRSGLRADVSEIRTTGATFSCSGRVEFPGRRRVFKWTIWKPNGRQVALGESQLDIVGPWFERPKAAP